MMNKLLVLISLALMVNGCSQRTTSKSAVYFDAPLQEQLLLMKELDQQAAYSPQDHSDEVMARWEVFKDSIFSSHCLELKEIFRTRGYLGFSRVGEDGETAFWVMIQHCDHDVDFQNAVLSELKRQVKKKNAKPSHLALLTDRVKINSGEKQIYGTQVMYNHLHQAVPKPLEDSLHVDKRRLALGLDPIKDYLNLMTVRHFNMNKENMIKRGLNEPVLHE